MKNALTRCLALGLALVFLATATADAGLFGKCGKAKSGISMKAKFRTQQAAAPCGAQQQAATQVNIDVRVRGPRRAIVSQPMTSCQGAQCTPSAQSPAPATQVPAKSTPCPNGQCPTPAQAPVIQLFVPVPVSQAPTTPEPTAPGAGLLSAISAASLGYLEDAAPTLPPAPATMQPAAPAKPEPKWYDLTTHDGWYGYGVKDADGYVHVTHYSSKITGELRTVDAAAPAPPDVPQPTDSRFGAVGDYYGFTAWLNGVRAQYGLGAVGHDPNLDAWAAQNNNHQNAYGMGHHVMGPARRQNSGMGASTTVWQMWMASPAHRAALLDPSISWIGIAASGAYWTFNAY